ncbi:MAG TPA: HAD-IG family 5'-nucleotidase [Holophagaceae bacterium]|nr:HAD-IG family 5'-nucleotidase [Holophagaceae bacterium]
MVAPLDPSLLPVPHSWDAGADEDRLPPSHKVYALRNLPMGDLGAVGFDMDYTLARYRSPEIDALAFRKAVRLLVRERDYPTWLLEAPYDPAFAVRGLVLDGLRGNLLKINRERQVVRAVHGLHALDAEAREAVYGRRRLAGSAKGFRSIDTLFEIPESALYATLVEGFDQKKLPSVQDYVQIFHDVRWAIDTAHRHGEMKAEILAHREFFIPKDPQLALALERLRRDGKRLFLLTNSEWSFTNGVLSHLLDGQDETRPRWTDYFDTIVVSARKPSFYEEGHPPQPVGGDAPAHAFVGGNAAWLEERVEATGEEILYGGDHIYGDILKSKKTSSWRTLMVIPELERELELLEQKGPELRRLVQLETLRRRTLRRASILLDQWQRNRHHRQALAQRLSPEALEALDKEATSLDLEAEALDRKAAEQGAEAAQLIAEVEAAFSPLWGPIFRESGEQTRFADQIQQYACAYTGKVSNLYAYDPEATVFAPLPTLPHERW